MSRYVIVGAGAVGASLAAQLQLAGIEVLLIARGEQLTAVREHGLRYLRPDGEQVLRIPVAAGPGEAELRADDVLVLAIKSQDTAAAVRDWARQPVKRADGSTGTAADLPVVTLQNGLENERLALRHFATVLGAVIWIPASYVTPGEVVSPGAPCPSIIWLGAYPNGTHTATEAPAEAVAADLRRAGSTVQVVPDIARWKAGKLIGNVLNVLDALYAPSDLRDAAAAALQDEARAVLAAAGLDPADPGTESTVDTATFHLEAIAGHEHIGHSTWQSLARATPPETDYLNGEIVLLGRLHGVPAVRNAAVQARMHRAVAEGVAPGSLDDTDLAAVLPGLSPTPADTRAEVLVEVDELHRLLAGPDAPVLLDVRWALGDPHGAEHYRAGHLPGASYVDLDTELSGPHAPGAGRHPLPDIATLQAHARRWGVSRDRGVVVYDAGGGLAAARAWWLLRWAGVPNVRILDGGLAAWAAAGHGQATGNAHPGPAGDIVLTPGHLPTISADQAAALPGTGSLLDARAGERYRGEVEPVDPRAGHIPGAVSAPTIDNLVDGAFRSTAELRARFAGLGDGPVGVYCGSGVTAAHEIAALAVAGIDAALYPGSWSAWSADPDRPAQTGTEDGRCRDLALDPAGRGPDAPMTVDPLDWLPSAHVRFSADPVVRSARRADRSGWPPDGLPAAVAFPRTADEVSRVLRLAHDNRTPVVPRGAGTGLSGASTAGTGTVVLDLSGMNRIVAISAEDGTAIAEPGVITADLDRAAAEHGMRYAPDPASVAISTIGGNIATNAGGLRCAKYGVTRDSVLGLDVVLADGRRISTGRATLKGVTGYDLTGLIVGSEGTLGVVVRATLRLRPAPRETATIAASFADVEAAATAAVALTRAGVQPSVAELLDEATLLAIDAAQGTTLRSGGAALLLVQTDGVGAFQEAALIAAVLSGTAVSVRTTTDEAEAAELLAARRLALPSLERLGRPLIEDIAVPRSRLADAVREIAVIAARHGVPITTVAHAGDGNLHPLIVVDPAATTIPHDAQAAADDIFALALRLGGTLTGEHGVGTLKRAWLRRELGETSHGLQQQIKRLFDPYDILNPGKAI